MKKKIRRYLIYVLAFFIVLSRRFSKRLKPQMAYSLCVAVLLCSVFPYFYEGNLSYSETRVIAENISAVTNTGQDASVIMTNSKIIKASENLQEEYDQTGDRNRVVTNESSAGEELAKNIVKEAPESLALIEGIRANYGITIGDVELEQKYQYPVEEGQRTDSNYNRTQKAGDYILRDIYKVETEEDTVSENDVQNDTEGNDVSEDEGVEVVEASEEQQEVVVSTNSISSNSVIVENTDLEEQSTERLLDAGCYTFSGTLNESGNYYLSDILLRPLGIDGYDLVRIGNSGKFYRSLRLTQEGTNLMIPLYFSDGRKISNEVLFGYSKDTVSPCQELATEGLNTLKTENNYIYCFNKDKMNFSVSDAEPGSGIANAKYEFGDRMKYVLDDFATAGIIFDQNYYGSVKLQCEDNAGNRSKTEEIYCLYENSPPQVIIDRASKCTAPYSMWVYIEEEGEIVSGIKEILCKVNEKEVELTDLCISEMVTLYPGLTVPTKGWYQVLFEETGEYEVEFTVEDNAGNITVQKQSVSVTEPELVSVFMPEHFTIHIDPQQLTEREQIYSDDIKLVNNSQFDVRVNVDEVILNVNSSFSEEGVEKDCQIYLVAPDTGEKILLQKGANTEVYSYKLPIDIVTEAENLYFCGDTTVGSDAMWEDSDISIQLKLSFEKWED